jgi:hypothetical protein
MTLMTSAGLSDRDRVFDCDLGACTIANGKDTAFFGMQAV